MYGRALYYQHLAKNNHEKLGSTTEMEIFEQGTKQQLIWEICLLLAMITSKRLKRNSCLLKLVKKKLINFGWFYRFRCFHRVVDTLQSLCTLMKQLSKPNWKLISLSCAILMFKATPWRIKIQQYDRWGDKYLTINYGLLALKTGLEVKFSYSLRRVEAWNLERSLQILQGNGISLSRKRPFDI